MTTFEILVPVAALTIAALGAWLLQRETRRLEAQAERHPAE